MTTVVRTRRDRVKALYQEVLAFYRQELGDSFIFPTSLSEEELVVTVETIFGRDESKWDSVTKRVMSYHGVTLPPEKYEKVYPKTVSFLKQLFELFV